MLRGEAADLTVIVVSATVPVRTPSALHTISGYASEADEASETVSRTVSYTYDAFGRQVEVDDTDSGATQTSYDELGRVEWVTKPQGVVNYAYDDVTGALVRTWTSTTPGGSAGTSVAYGYRCLCQLDLGARADFALSSISLS